MARAPSFESLRGGTRSVAAPLAHSRVYPPSGFLTAVHRPRARPLATMHRALACLSAAASRHDAFCAHTPPRHMPQAPTPWVSRWWLFQPHQRARCWQCLWLLREQLWACGFPSAAVPQVVPAPLRRRLGPSLTLLRPAPICPGLCSDGFFSLASELDACGALDYESTGVVSSTDSARARPCHINAQLSTSIVPQATVPVLSDRDCAYKPKSVKISGAAKEDR